MNRDRTASIIAMHKLKEIRITEYNKNPKQCITCNSIISYKKRCNKFCSRRCAAIYNNRKFPKRQAVIRMCEICGIRITGNGSKYCSIACWGTATRAKTTLRIEAGEHVDSGRIRKYLKSTRPHQCVICKKKTWMGKPIPLTMDHIDGNPGNDSLDNLRLVCANCDRQLPTFGSGNRGFGRKSRGMKRYDDPSTLD